MHGCVSVHDNIVKIGMSVDFVISAINVFGYCLKFHHMSRVYLIH